MSKRTVYLIFSLAVAAFVVFAVLMEHAGSGPARVRVESKQESGYGFVDREAVRKYVEGKLEGVPSDSVPGRLLPLEQHIARSPYVERAMVYRRPSGEVRVDLWEEQPSFRLVTDTGNYYVSRKDRLMPVQAGVGVDVPWVSGQVYREAFPKVREVIARVEQDDFFSAQTVGIRVSRRQKSGKAVYDFALDTRAGLQVVLGEADELDLKFENFGIIYAYLFSAGKTDAYKVVNLEFGNYVICKKK